MVNLTYSDSQHSIIHPVGSIPMEVAKLFYFQCGKCVTSLHLASQI